jgi:hypothetical protein
MSDPLAYAKIRQAQRQSILQANRRAEPPQKSLGRAWKTVVVGFGRLVSVASGSLWNWNHAIYQPASQSFTDGGTGSGMGNVSPLFNAPAHASGLVLDSISNNGSGSGVTGSSLIFLPLTPALPSFPVLVHNNGGSAGNSTTLTTYAYDLYALTDTGLTTKLNLSGAIQPVCSRARIILAQVTAAGSGSVGMAYYNASGVIQLFDCQETINQTNC